MQRLPQRRLLARRNHHSQQDGSGRGLVFVSVDLVGEEKTATHQVGSAIAFAYRKGKKRVDAARAIEHAFADPPRPPS